MSPRATPGPFVLYRQDGCTGPVRRQDVCAAWKGPAGAPAHVLRAPCYRVLYACLCNIHFVLYIKYVDIERFIVS